MVESCSIRQLQVTDLPTILRWRNHPDIRRFMFTQHEISLDEHRNWFDKASLDPRRSMLIVEDAKQAIGYVQFSKVEDGSVSDWGFYARPDAPKGTGRRLGVIALNYAFGTLQLHKICGQAIASNKASIGFHERLGFTKEAELREHQYINGEYHTLICYGLLAREWNPATVR